MHEIMEHDMQEGREMAWHGLTQVRADLSLENCWLGTWDYVAKRVVLDTGEKTPFYVLGVTDDCFVDEMVYDAEKDTDVPTGEKIRLMIGEPYCGDSFKPVTNKRLLELLIKGTAGKDIQLASAGTIKNRGRQFASFQMGDSYRAAGRDFVPFFNVGNGNDKTSPVWQNISTTCTVCNNTFTMNMLDGGLIMQVKKTKYSELALGDFSQAMRSMLAGQKEFAEILESLAMLKCHEDQARMFFAGFLGEGDSTLSTRTAHNIERLVTLFKSGPGNEGKNWSDVFQAATDYFTHESASGEGDLAANWKNFQSSEFGNGRKQKQKLWAFITVDGKRNTVVKLGRDILKRTDQKIAAIKAANTPVTETTQPAQPENVETAKAEATVTAEAIAS